MTDIITRLQAAYEAHPSRFIGYGAAIIVFVLAKVGVIVDEQNVGQALVIIAPILLGTEGVHAKVTPTAKVAGPVDDEVSDVAL